MGVVAAARFWCLLLLMAEPVIEVRPGIGTGARSREDTRVAGSQCHRAL
jgi:hypothetical protein